MLLEIILGCIVVLALLILFITIGNNKFSFAIIRIEEAENNIEVLLHKKYDLLQRCCPIIIKELKVKDFLPDIGEIKLEKINHFELNDTLKKGYNELFKTIDNNEKLPENDQDVVFKGDNWIGMNTTILKGVEIGRGGVIAAGAVVNKDIPSYSIAGGVPAKVIKSRKEDK